ncbi:MAG: hypothetical protein KFB96_10860 [Thiocapsa sp.]|uniref:hypothetical protein n=1 Tax=Thiocapsa sp. TaxID=2024551 RepID=UPI001BCC6F84|nr:hypothetical protein [Thiocapsa sp.]QVL50853.1 MAG: hypothetical protein KFB96_10860 [Thiocapsa sp.]
MDRLLGFRQLVGAEGAHHREPETSSGTVKGYRPPDARLGWFGSTVDLTRAVLELKAPGADLDAKQGAGYGKLTPVEQAFGYAAKVDGCRWVIVSNFIELRLYRTGPDHPLHGRTDHRRLAGRASCADRGPASHRPARPPVERDPTDTHARYAGPMQQRAAEIRALERRLSALVNQAYRLSDDDIALIRRTAPPRMPGD